MEVRLNIADRSVILRYTVNAMCAVEEAAGGDLDGIMKCQFSAARLLLWGGMIDRQPETTLAQAGSLIDEHLAAGGSLALIVDACADAMERAGFLSDD